MNFSQMPIGLTFDRAKFPSVPTRKALIVIDFQNDFVTMDGGLPVAEAADIDGLVGRIAELVTAFHAAGDKVIWVQSQFEKKRGFVEGQHIVTRDADPPSSSLPGRPRPTSWTPADAADAVDTDAFLSHDPPRCVVRGTVGWQMAPALKKVVDAKRDLFIMKSNYSAFKDTKLLDMLRPRFITTLYMCGSLVNVGVHATAMEAASHALSVKIVRDCGGFTSMARSTLALRNLVDETGCEVVVSGQVMELFGGRAVAKTASDAGGKATKADSTTKGATNGVTKGAKSQEAKESANESRPEVVDDALSRLSISVDGDSEYESRLSPVPRGTRKDGKTTLLRENQSPKSPTPGSPDLLPRLVPDLMAPSKVRDPGLQRSSSPSSRTDDNDDNEGGTMVTNRGPDQPDVASVRDSRKSEPLCEGDTAVIYNALPRRLEESAFDRLKDEVQWKRMSHQGGEVPRLVAVQGDVADDDSMPVYRHPSDESPPLTAFSPTVLKIKEEVEKHLGHALNHVLIQFYRDGKDYISEHSDKTLDIVPGTYIANLSLGAERTMVFRTKRADKDPSTKQTRGASPGEPDAAANEGEAIKGVADLSSTRQIQKAKLPHNSLCRMGLETNMRWLHAIKQDKRRDVERTAAELAFGGGRISLTFRQIGTFLTKDETLIWGQGATAKTRDAARAVVNFDEMLSTDLVYAFGTENHSSNFDWDAHYGRGFDVLHMSRRR